MFSLLANMLAPCNGREKASVNGYIQRRFKCLPVKMDKKTKKQKTRRLRAWIWALRRRQGSSIRPWMLPAAGSIPACSMPPGKPDLASTHAPPSDPRRLAREKRESSLDPASPLALLPNPAFPGAAVAGSAPPSEGHGTAAGLRRRRGPRCCLFVAAPLEARPTGGGPTVAVEGTAATSSWLRHRSGR